MELSEFLVSVLINPSYPPVVACSFGSISLFAPQWVSFPVPSLASQLPFLSKEV